MRVRTSEVQDNPNQPRKTYDKAKIVRLGKSMLKHGQLQPIGITPDKEVIYGGCRLEAARMFGIEFLEATIFEKQLNLTDTLSIQVVENIHRSDLTGWEKWQAFLELMRLNPDWQLKDLAEHVCLDPSMVTRVMSPSKCIGAGPRGVEGKESWAFQIVTPLPASCRKSEQAGLLAMKLSGAHRATRLSIRPVKKRNGTPAVRVSRIVCPLPSGTVVQVSGQKLSLDDMAAAIAELLKLAKRASSDGMCAKTFERMCQDKAKAS